jgi:hypothetical protein
MPRPGARGATQRYPRPAVVHMIARGETPRYWKPLRTDAQRDAGWIAHGSVFDGWRESRQVSKCLNDTPPETLTDIQRAARFYYLQQNCFGGRVEGRTNGTRAPSPPELNMRRLKEILSAAHLRLSRAYIETLDWPVCVCRYDCPHTFFYFDPPYWQTRGYGYCSVLSNTNRWRA